MQLSEHFSLEEMTVSETAARHDLDNTPTGTALDSLKHTAVVMEQVRALLGHPLHVNSAYRAPEVNAAVGGVKTSAHCYGMACDFVCPAFGDTYAVACAVRDSGTEFDQLILEYGWVHIGVANPHGGNLRHQCLTKRSAKAPYIPGIVR
jgi:zinc D-Ala-D-Ala carboxypeptidase